MSFKKSKHRSSAAGGLRVVALLEGAKGVLVLLAGFELLSFVHKDIHQAAMRLVTHLHLNPASHYPRIFLDLSERIDDMQLWGMALAAAIYAIVRLAEAVGLWLRREWAEWFAILTGAIYIPVEIFAAVQSVTWPKVTVLLVNAGVVSYLLYLRSTGGRKRAG